MKLTATTVPASLLKAGKSNGQAVPIPSSPTPQFHSSQKYSTMKSKYLKM